MRDTQTGIEVGMDWDAVQATAAALRDKRAAAVAKITNMCPHGCGRVVNSEAMPTHYLTEHLARETAAVRVYDLKDERDERAAGVD